MENKVILVRSSRELVEKGYVGYGWNTVDFSQYSTVKELLEEGFNGIDIGRSKKQIKRYFELKLGDIVVVPVAGAIAIGIIEGKKEYDYNSNIPLSTNRIKVNFFKNNSNKIMYVPRVNIATSLERRLKIRMTVADLEIFKEEIKKIILKLENNEIYTWDSDIQEKEEVTKNIFIKELEERLRTEKGLGFAAGGYGLEKLIRDLFEAKGYESRIPSKQERPTGEDVDIIASLEGEFGSKGERYLIQAKHHRGVTGRVGLDQLIACKDEEDDETHSYKKILITTATVSEELKQEAKSNNIIIVEGYQLAEWIFDNIELLSRKTLLQLGISKVPSLL